MGQVTTDKIPANRIFVGGFSQGGGMAMSVKRPPLSNLLERTYDAFYGCLPGIRYTSLIRFGAIATTIPLANSQLNVFRCEWIFMG